MTAWIVAAVAAVVTGWLAYGALPSAAGRDVAPPPTRGPLAALLAAARGLAVGLVVAVLLGAPAGRRPPPAPLLAVDVSESWRRAASDDAEARWAAARAAADGVDSVLLVGDSARLVEGAVVGTLDAPADARSRLRPAVDRALALGRPLRLVTDGEADDPALLDALPAGSELVVPTAPVTADVAIADLQLPDAVVGGDTVAIDVSLQAGRGGAPARRLRVRIDGGEAIERAVAALAPWERRTERVALSVPRGDAERAVVAALGPAPDATPPSGGAGPDRVARNDTLVGRLVVRDAPRVVVVSTAPDLDVREALRVLRGTGAGGARAFLRIAPGQWRVEGTLARIDEADVLAQARGADLLVVHGDASWGGEPRAGQARIAWRPAPPPAPARAGELPPVDEWYVDAPLPSPLATVLSALPVDSLAPLSLGAALARAASGGAADADADSATAAAPRSATTTVALTARLRRGGAPRPLLLVDDAPRARRVELRGSGWASWALREGRGRAAFDALFGAIFDWAAAGAQADDAPVLVSQLVRRGDALRWRRGADSVVTVRVVPRGDGDVNVAAAAGTDSFTVRFAGGAREADSPAPAEGAYELVVASRRTPLVVNPSREWVPRVPVADSVARDTSRAARDAVAGPPRPLREASWPLVAALLLLCAEWIGRRAAGLR